MPIPWTSSPLKVAPGAANGVTVTPSGSSWVAGAYVEVVASTSAAWLLAGVGISPSSAFESFGNGFEIDVAVGAAGSESVIGTFRGAIFGTAGIGRGLLLSPILIDAVPSGSRVAVRVRESSGNTGTYNVTVHYYEQPATGSLPSTAQPLLALPSASPTSSLSSSGTAWANGSYVEIAASLATDIVIVGLVYGDVNNGATYEIDLATGGSGSESVIATVRDMSHGITNGEPFFVPLGVPISVVSGSRLAARLRSSPGSTSAFLALWYFEAPLGSGVESRSLTTSPLRVAPSASTATPAFGSSGAFGDWVEIIATAPADLTLAGFCASPLGTFDIQVGIGADGLEVPIATFKRSGALSPAQTDSVLLPTPIGDAIPSGSRVAVRVRSDAAIGSNPNIALYYYEDLDSDNVTPAAADGFPATGSLASLTPSATAWASSAWVELEDATTQPLSLYGIPFESGVDAEYEIDLGIGAAGAETVMATVHGYSSSGIGTAVAILPALIPLAISTRVAVRARRNSTDTGAGFAAGAVYYGPPTPDAILGGIALGYRGTVQSSRSVIISLDGNSNVLNEVGKMKVFGKFEVTGAVTFASTTLSSLLDVLGNTVGDMLYRAGSVWQRLAGNTTATKKFLSQTGTGSASAAPVWAQVADADLATSDIATNDVSTTKHGFVPKAPNDTTKFLRGDATWAIPAGGAGSLALDDLTDVDAATPSDGDVLTYSSGSPAGWVNAAPSGVAGGGALVLLEQHAASSSASLDFTSISATYDEYVIEIVNLVNGSAAIPMIRLSTDGGSSYDSGSNYDWGYAFNYSGGSGTIFGASASGVQWRDANTTLAANGSWNGTFRLFAPGGALYKHLNGDIACRDSSAGVVFFHGGGQYKSTSAVDALSVVMSSGNIASGTVRLYGVAK